MFLVFNRDKMVTYMISFCTVMILLGLAFAIKNNKINMNVMKNNVISVEKNK